MILLKSKGDNRFILFGKRSVSSRAASDGEGTSTAFCACKNKPLRHAGASEGSERATMLLESSVCAARDDTRYTARLATHRKRAYTGAVRAVWKKIRYRLEWLALKGAAKIVPLLSRNACYRLAQVTGALAATVDRAGRRVALSNLQVAFGDELSPGRRAEIVRESYQHFARTMLDLFWSPRLTSQNYSRYIEVENLDLWREEMDL